MLVFFLLLWEFVNLFILRKRLSLLLLSLTLVQIRIAKLYGVTSYCRRESKNPFLQVIKTVVKKFDINFFYYFDLNFMCLTLYSLMSARYSECHGCSPKKINYHLLYAFCDVLLLLTLSTGNMKKS